VKALEPCGTGNELHPNMLIECLVYEKGVVDEEGIFGFGRDSGRGPDSGSSTCAR
jgi:hypothetical protein